MSLENVISCGLGTKSMLSISLSINMEIAISLPNVIHPFYIVFEKLYFFPLSMHKEEHMTFSKNVKGRLTTIFLTKQGKKPHTVIIMSTTANHDFDPYQILGSGEEVKKFLLLTI